MSGYGEQETDVSRIDAKRKCADAAVIAVVCCQSPVHMKAPVTSSETDDVTSASVSHDQE